MQTPRDNRYERPKAVSMNDTIYKFGYPASLIHEYQHWVVLLRPQQVTLGSLVLAAKAEVTHYHALPAEAFSEMQRVVTDIETTLATVVGYERMNYLMLMMVDPHVHYHVLPRYNGSRVFDEANFPDQSWPGPPALNLAAEMNDASRVALLVHVRSSWPD